MKINNIQSLTGRNIYCHRPVIKMTVDIEEFHNVTTKDIKGLKEKLIDFFPGLKKHYCSPGYEGGFIERLSEGTYAGHVIEHIALELQNMNGYDVFFGRTRVLEEPSIYNIVFEYKNEKLGLESGKAAVEIIDKLFRNEAVDMEKILTDLSILAVEFELGPSTRSIFDEAEKRGIPVTRIGDDSMLRLGYGKYSRLVSASLTDVPSCISVDIVGNKHLTKQILSSYGIPVPYGHIAYSEDAAIRIAKEIGYPVVIKPCDVNQGKGVTLNIFNEEQVRIAYKEAIKYCRAVIVEKFVEGTDYRVLVIGNKIAAVSERKPPIITGDGKHTIKELIEIENRNPARGEGHEKPLTRIKIDSVVLQTLSVQGIDENYIPAAGENVVLRGNGNLSTGGTARECTEEIHPDNKEMAIKAAKAVGLDIAGIDIKTPDISVPINENNGAILEVNAAPGLRMHLYPSEGNSKNVAEDIVNMLFPEGSPCSIPIVSITGTNGKTTTTRLVSHTLALSGLKVGMTSSSGVFIGNECIVRGDCTGAISAGLVLANKEVEAAVLETARGGIINKGLGYNLADVGVIVNISEDHLGLDNINTLEDLAFVKSLVVEAVKPDGYAVINADNDMCHYFLKRVKSKLILFSKNKNNPLIVRHIRSGGVAVTVKDGLMSIYDNTKITPVVAVSEIPITMGGIAEFNVENSLAAVSSLYALNIPISIIREGLMSFKSDIENNPGRINMFDMDGFKIMLDYGHNPAGYKAVIQYLQRIKANRYVGILGMPGDRMDRHIREVGELCSKAFHKFYIKEDRCLRGRCPGEVADILYDSLIIKGVDKNRIEIIYSETEALEKAIMNAEPGDLIVMFYEKFEPAVEIIQKLKQSKVKKPLIHKETKESGTNKEYAAMI
ncbi:MAG TPA: cyanophycin synthetase [Clostridiaceae bacterium]|nr:cyanophycin synthetase [Clostridiaceae bacterium]